MAGGKCNRGWGLKSVQEHVEASNDTAEYAKELAEHNARDIEALEKRLADLEGQPNE